MRAILLLAALAASAASGERPRTCESYRSALAALQGAEMSESGHLAARALGEALQAECGAGASASKTAWPRRGFADPETWKVYMSEPEKDWVRALFFEDPH